MINFLSGLQFNNKKNDNKTYTTSDHVSTAACNNNNNNNNLFIQRLTDRRLVYNGITQVWEVLEWRQSAANRKVQPAGSLQPTPPLWCTCPSRSWSQLCCLVGRGTCVWTTYPRLIRGMPRSGIELATFWSRVANANHWATAPHKRVWVTTWPFGVTWHHQSRDHSIPFPVGGPLKRDGHWAWAN